MGLLDNLFKNLDDVLKDIEEGGLEKRLDNLANMIGDTSEKVVNTTEKFVEAPGRVLDIAEEKAKQVEERVQVIGQQTGKTMDIMRQAKKDAS